MRGRGHIGIAGAVVNPIDTRLGREADRIAHRLRLGSAGSMGGKEQRPSRIDIITLSSSLLSPLFSRRLSSRKAE